MQISFGKQCIISKNWSRIVNVRVPWGMYFKIKETFTGLFLHSRRYGGEKKM